MIILADVFNATDRTIQYNRQFIELESANRSIALDSIGTFKFSVPWLTPNTRNAIKTGRYIKIRFVNAYGQLEQFVEGYIEDVQRGLSVGSTNISVSCADSLQELKYTTVLLNLIYENEDLETVIPNLVSRAGWTADVEPTTTTVSARFDGPPISKALQNLTKSTGLHFRQHSTEPRRIVFGSLDDLNPIILTNYDTAEPNPRQIALVSNLTLKESGNQIFNYIVPQGGGEGDASLTLENSTRPGILSTIGPGGKIIYYISDTDSIYNYGKREQIVAFKDIQQVSNTEEGRVSAANFLYDAAVVYLRRHTVPKRQYTFSVVTHVDRDLMFKPGQLVNLRYLGPVRDETGELHINEEKIEETFYILKVTESIGNERNITLEVSTTDESITTPEDAVANVIEKAQSSALSVKSYPVTFTLSRSTEFGAATGAGYFSDAAPVTINNQYTNINRIILSIMPRLMKAHTEIQIAAGVLYGTRGLSVAQEYPIIEDLYFVERFIPIGLGSVPLNNTSYDSNGVIFDKVTKIGSALGSVESWGPLTFDITDLLLNSQFGIYQTFAIYAVPRIFTVNVGNYAEHGGNYGMPIVFPYYTVAPSYNVGGGALDLDFTISATVQANSEG